MVKVRLNKQSVKSLQGLDSVEKKKEPSLEFAIEEHSRN